MEKQSDNGVLEEFRVEFLDCWRRLPNKGFFLILLAAWLALFQFFGNSTLGYARTPSLMYWMHLSLTDFGRSLVDTEEGFGVLVPLIVLGLFWLKRRQLLALDLKAWWPGLVLVAFGLALHLLGFVIQQPKISVIGLFAGLYGLMGLAWGLAWLRASFFPFFLLAFCVPLGPVMAPITFRLRMLVTWLVESVCHYLLAIDVVREGTQLVSPIGHYSYEVAAACSGIRSLVATLTLALILGFFSFRTPWKRLLVIASAFPLAVLGNLLRMLSIVIAAELGGQDAGTYVHDGGPGGIFSLLPYVPAFAGLLLLERYWGEREPSQPAQALQPKAA